MTLLIGFDIYHFLTICGTISTIKRQGGEYIMKKLIPLMALILFIKVVIPPPTITINPNGTATVVRPTPQVTVINTLRQDILNSIQF